MLDFHLVTRSSVHGYPTRQAARQAARAAGLRWGQYAVLIANDTDEEADEEAIAQAKRTIAARAHLEAALELVESASIRAWARSPWNRPLFVRLAALGLQKNGPASNVHMFAAFITSSAIGL